VQTLFKLYMPSSTLYTIMFRTKTEYYKYMLPPVGWFKNYNSSGDLPCQGIRRGGPLEAEVASCMPLAPMLNHSVPDDTHFLSTLATSCTGRNRKWQGGGGVPTVNFRSVRLQNPRQHSPMCWQEHTAQGNVSVGRGLCSGNFSMWDAPRWIDVRLRSQN
jgi:hypothetical protein